jgi:hypothetical protein
MRPPHNPPVVGSIPTGPTVLRIRPRKEKVLAPKRADSQLNKGLSTLFESVGQR